MNTEETRVAVFALVAIICLVAIFGFVAVSNKPPEPNLSHRIPADVNKLTLEWKRAPVGTRETAVVTLERIGRKLVFRRSGSATAALLGAYEAWESSSGRCSYKKETP
jgi:hypothetical protein